jgi:hypothetical protein
MTEKTAELEELCLDFSAAKMFSEVLFSVFLEVAKGRNYVTKIARSRKRSKAIISRQLKELVHFRLVRGWGEGMKQTFSVDWEVFTYFWISTTSPALSMFNVISDGIKDILSEVNVPGWMGKLYFSQRELKMLETWNKGKTTPEDVLEKTLIPAIPDVSPIVEMLVKVADSKNFYDAFSALSRSFATGLPDIEEAGIEFGSIKDERTKQLLKALYSDEVKLWLKVNVSCDFYAANIVRNVVLEKLSLIEK